MPTQEDIDEAMNHADKHPMIATLAAAYRAEKERADRLIAIDHTRRWNIEENDGGIRICRGQHDKNDPCEWEEFTPKAT